MNTSPLSSSFCDFPHLYKAIEVVKRLRNPESGCPWDLKQNASTLLPYLIEETYEFVQAVENQDIPSMKEELGDILLQVLLQSQIAEDEKTFTLEDVAQTLQEKLIHRHPHVFKANENAPKLSQEEALQVWNKAKQEQLQKNPMDILKGYASLPGTLSAKKIGDFAKNYKFDWDHPGQVLYKVEEEWQELKELIPPSNDTHEKRHDQEHVEEELGDLLFSIIQLARHLKVDPEISLQKANQKFVRRFRFMYEKATSLEGDSFEKLNLEQKERLWIAAKKQNL